MEVKSELENKMFEALYPETQILENTEMWTQLKCQRCGETFPDKQSRGRHLRERHGEVKSYMCEVCGKSFSHRSGLTHHIPMHSDVKSFRCNICGKPFRQRSGLAHHKQTHSGVKAFTCNICGKSFAQGTGLIHHKTTHSSVKIFSCSICGKSFAQSSGLAHHRHIHIKKMVSSTGNCQQQQPAVFNDGGVSELNGLNSDGTGTSSASDGPVGFPRVCLKSAEGGHYTRAIDLLGSAAGGTLPPPPLTTHSPFNGHIVVTSQQGSFGGPNFSDPAGSRRPFSKPQDLVSSSVIQLSRSCPTT